MINQDTCTCPILNLSEHYTPWDKKKKNATFALNKERSRPKTKGYASLEIITLLPALFVYEFKISNFKIFNIFYQKCKNFC